MQFPTLPKLLLSARDLVALNLGGYGYVTSAGFISPDTIATCLSTLTRLKYLCIIFRSPELFFEQRNPSRAPLTRAVLPSLSLLMFQGDSEY